MSTPSAHDALSARDAERRHRLDHEPVLFVSGCEGATRRYRCLHQAEQLFLRGIPVRVVSPWQHDIVDAGLGHSFVILHRVAWDPTVQMLIDQTRDTGGVALFDIDDLVFEPESTHLHRGVAHLPPDQQTLYHDGVRRYRKTLLASDGAIVPTTFLAERIRALGLPAWVSRNCIDMELLERSKRAEKGTRLPVGGGGGGGGGEGGTATAAPRPLSTGPNEADADERIVIGYASGSRTHDQDFAEAAGPAVLRIMERRPEVELRIVGPLGIGAEWDAVRDRIRHIEAVEWRALPAEIAQFDINVAPLELDNPFCSAKSELKWLEASACGVPTVASATEAFQHAIRDGVDGLLATDTIAWERVIESLIERPAERRTMGAAARATIERRRTTLAQAEAFERTLAKARTAVRPSTGPPQAPTFTDGRPNRGLSVAVLAPEPTQGSGGHTTLMRMVAGLESAGHSVTVYIEPGPHMRDASEVAVQAFMRSHFPPSAAKIRFGAEIDSCDVAIATGWTTALQVAAAECARTKLYFVQDFEPYFQPLSADSLAAEATYSLGLGHITIGPWLAETLRQRYSARAVAIDFGVEHEIYAPSAAIEIARGPAAESEASPRTTLDVANAAPQQPRVVFYGRGETPRRGVALGLEALARVKAARPDVEIVLYGGDQPGLADFPHVHAGVLSRPELAALYRSATVGLALSYTNLSLVPIEMAACGLPVVAIDAEPVRWYQKDGETCLVTAPTAEAIADGILRVLDDAVLRRQLAAGGLSRVAGMTWERASAQFVRYVEDYAAADVRVAVVGAGDGGTADLGAAYLAMGDVAMTDVALANRTMSEVAGGDDRGVEPFEPSPLLETLSGDPDPQLLAIGPNETLRLDEAEDMSDSAGALLGPIDWDMVLTADGLRRVELRLRPNGIGVDAALALQILEHASSPRAIATAVVAVRDILDEAWTAFDFRLLTDSAGRRLHLRLSALPVLDARTTPNALAPISSHTLPERDAGRDKAEISGSPIAWLEIDATGRPAYRSWCDGRRVQDVGAADDPAIRDLLHRRRRSLALRRLRLAQLRRRRILASLTRLWWRWSRPVPPGPLRPWRNDAPASDKLWGGLTIYGPLPVARELVAWLRFRFGARKA